MRNTKLEEKKIYLIENNLTHLVRELVQNLGFSSEEAVEHVYDSKMLSKNDFKEKYLRCSEE